VCLEALDEPPLDRPCDKELPVDRPELRHELLLGLRIRGSSNFAGLSMFFDKIRPPDPGPGALDPPESGHRRDDHPALNAVDSSSHSLRERDVLGHCTETPKPGTPLTPFHNCRKLFVSMERSSAVVSLDSRPLHCSP